MTRSAPTPPTRTRDCLSARKVALPRRSDHGPRTTAPGRPRRIPTAGVPGARFGAAPGPGPRSSAKHPDGWRPGLKVRHATFGSGVILQVQGTGAQTRLVCFFDRAGRKTLIPSLAKLEKV